MGHNINVSNNSNSNSRIKLGSSRYYSHRNFSISNCRSSHFLEISWSKQELEMESFHLHNSNNFKSHPLFLSLSNNKFSKLHSNSKFSKLLSTSSINSNSNSNNNSNNNSNSSSIINSNKSNKSNSSNNNNNNNNKTNHRYYRGGHSRCLLRTVIKEGEGKVRC